VGLVQETHAADVHFREPQDAGGSIDLYFIGLGGDEWSLDSFTR
jgi:hypothetical protein